MTTIKLAYWAVLTIWELAAPRGLAIACAVLASIGAVLWAIRAARSNGEAIWFWVATFLVGFLVVPAAFALALRPDVRGHDRVN